MEVDRGRMAEKERKVPVGVKLVKAHVAGSGEAEDVGVCRPGKSSCEMSER